MEASREAHLRPPPGTGRLGVVSAYFTLAGLASAAVTAAIVTATLFPRLGWQITPGNPWLAIPGGALLTFGFLRTNRLLRRRQRVGAHLAVVCLGTSVAAAVYSRDIGWFTLGLPLLGLGLLASVWRHLE